MLAAERARMIRALKNQTGSVALPVVVVGSELQSLDVGGLQTLGALLHRKLNGLAFFQRPEAVRLDSGEVNENIFASLAADEPVALCVVEPLNGALFHGVADPSLLV